MCFEIGYKSGLFVMVCVNFLLFGTYCGDFDLDADRNDFVRARPLFLTFFYGCWCSTDFKLCFDKVVDSFAPSGAFFVETLIGLSIVLLNVELA